jgi:hypothetical protein
MKVHLVLEGGLEEPVARKLLALSGHNTGNVFSLRGCKNVKIKSYKYHAITGCGDAVLVLTDYMDVGPDCACIKQARWEYFEKHIAVPSQNFLLRFAVRELESWLIADRKGVSDFLHIPLARVTAAPETLADPKNELVRLARMSKSSRIRDAIVPDTRHGGQVAPGYNGVMTDFVNKVWNPEIAQRNSESLGRCLAALRRL